MSPGTNDKNGAEPNVAERLQELSNHFPAAVEYLIQIYFLIRDKAQVVGARIAERLGVSPPAVTQALRRLARLKLVYNDSDNGIGLTEEGRKLAERAIRRHYLLERMLVDELGVSWNSVDEEAERLQNALSSELEEHLFNRLGKPSTCPHGNPMPGSKDEKKLLDAPTLMNVGTGETVMIVRVTEVGETTEGLLEFFAKNDLLPGTTCTIEDQDEDRLVIEAASGSSGRPATNRIDIPVRYAKHIRISEPDSGE